MCSFKQPGIYAYVNNNLIEAIMPGGAANVKVEGRWNIDLMEQVGAPICVGTKPFMTFKVSFIEATALG
jgi:hypothetical protein